MLIPSMRTAVPRPTQAVLHVAALAAFALCSRSVSAFAADATKFYFWVAPATSGHYTEKSDLAEGFVVEVDSSTADQIRSQIPISGNHIGVGGPITAGAVDYNQN